jgi:ribose 5-phosphate isomerase A
MDLKEILAVEAQSYLDNVDTLGLGTGKTVRTLIKHLHKEGLLTKFNVVCSSIDTELAVSQLGGKVLSIQNGIVPDVYLDSFDTLVRRRILVKGGGGALLREKLLAAHSKTRVYLGEGWKLREFPVSVPLEVVPATLHYIYSQLKREGYTVSLRESTGKAGPVVTDNGNLLMDLEARESEDLCQLESRLRGIVGIVETGIFCPNLYDHIVIAHDSSIERIERV